MQEPTILLSTITITKHHSISQCWYPFVRSLFMNEAAFKKDRKLYVWQQAGRDLRCEVP